MWLGWQSTSAFRSTLQYIINFPGFTGSSLVVCSCRSCKYDERIAHTHKHTHGKRPDSTESWEMRNRSLGGTHHNITYTPRCRKHARRERAQESPLPGLAPTWLDQAFIFPTYPDHQSDGTATTGGENSKVIQLRHRLPPVCATSNVPLSTPKQTIKRKAQQLLYVLHDVTPAACTSAQTSAGRKDRCFRPAARARECTVPPSITRH